MRDAMVAEDFGETGLGTLPDGKVDLAVLSWNGLCYSFIGNGVGQLTQTDTEHISGAWSASTPGGRTITRYRWAVSATPDATGIIPGGGWFYTTQTSGTRALSLTSGQTHYVLAQAEDSAHLWTSVGAADGILVQDPAQVNTPAAAKLIPDGWPVTLQGAIVSRAWPGSQWVCYVQDPDRTSGLRIEGSGTAPSAGAKVTASGVMGSSAGERVLLASSIHATGGSGEPAPLGLVSRSLGDDAIANVGLLVKIAGAVTRSEPGEDWFYVDDGSMITEGPAVGVRCICTGLDKPAVGSFVSVTGVSGVVDALRCVRVQRQADIIDVPRP